MVIQADSKPKFTLGETVLHAYCPYRLVIETCALHKDGSYVYLVRDAQSGDTFDAPERQLDPVES